MHEIRHLDHTTVAVCIPVHMLNYMIPHLTLVSLEPGLFVSPAQSPRKTKKRSGPTHSSLERSQTSSDPLTADQSGPVEVVAAVSSGRKHVLVRDVHCRHGDVVRLGELSDVSAQVR